jgi:large subunit ribosomal protein L31
MKDGIHPQYHPDAKFICACGHRFTAGSTKPEVHVEICSNCHPFYTGKQNLIDTAGTIDRFKRRTTKSAEIKSKRITKKLKAKA